MTEPVTADLLSKLLIYFTIAVTLCGCVSHTKYGDCVGLGEDQNPNLKYKLSTRNIVMGVIFFELIVPPIKVATDETFCPVGPKDAT